MQPLNFQEAVQKIRSDDPSYHADAYGFLRDALEATLKRRKKMRRENPSHISAAELLDGFRAKALQDFGPMSLMVLNHWGIRSSEDIGRMVFNLVAAGVFGRSEEDSLENFRDALDFEAAFVAPFRPAAEKMSNPAGNIVPKKT